eukprot:3579978-Amphidinium_carterae.1
MPVPSTPAQSPRPLYDGCTYPNPHLVSLCSDGSQISSTHMEVGMRHFPVMLPGISREWMAQARLQLSGT